MSKIFRARFVEALRQKYDLPDSLYRKLFAKRWVVYTKQPFKGPAQVVEYLGQYTHKIAISNHRIKALQAGKVTFQ